MISQRTKDALAAAKARGITLGGPKVLEAGELGRVALQAAADQRAANVVPIIHEIQAAGIGGIALLHAVEPGIRKPSRMC